MTVKTDKLNENQVAELLNNLMIEGYQLNNNGILDVFFNEDIPKEERERLYKEIMQIYLQMK